MSGLALLFYGLAGLAVAAALCTVLARGRTTAGLSGLLLTLLSLAGISLLLEAHLVAAVQVIALGGAVGVLFLFVVMLLDPDDRRLPPARQRAARLGSLLLLALALDRLLRVQRPLPELPPVPPGFGGYETLGRLLFTDYLVLVEGASLLLLAAVVGALLLSSWRTR